MLWHKYMNFTSRSWQEVILIWTSERKSLRQYRIVLSTPFSLNVSFEVGLVCLHSTRKLILIAYLHQLSYHSGPLKGFHCFRGWFSSPRLPVSYGVPSVPDHFAWASRMLGARTFLSFQKNQSTKQPSLIDLKEPFHDNILRQFHSNVQMRLVN